MIMMLKEDSEFHQRILKAEQMLDELGISISYHQASEGISITDTRSGRIFMTFQDIEYTFPRSCECRWKLV